MVTTNLLQNLVFSQQMISVKKYSLLLLTILLFAACKDTPKPVADDRKNDYALYDAQGGFHRFSRYNDSKAIVLYVQGNGCPIVRNGLTDFKDVVAKFAQKNVSFFMLNPNLQDTRSAIKKEAIDYNFNVPVLVDDQQLLADAFDINTTAEAIVLHPTSREVLYRGPINNRLDFEGQKEKASENYLVDALNAIVNQQAISLSYQVTKGCKVTRLKQLEKDTSLTYTQDIAPILKDYCVRCHKDGGLAPWAMTDYQTIAGWSAMIKEVLLSKRMPPWKADPNIGTFSNSFALPDSNARKIIRWIDNGLQPGNGADVLANLPKDTLEWEAGTPDKIITLKKEEIPATGIVPYRFQQIQLDLDRDTWLRGIAMKPGNTKVVHHFVVAEKGSNSQSLIVDRKPYPWIDNYIAVGTGGEETTLFPEQTGILIKKNTTLVVQIHYTSTGKAEIDQTQIGFYFQDQAPEKELYAISPSTTQFKIPPFAKDVTIVATDTITKDIAVHFVGPHMHYRGKSIKVSAQFPDGSEQTIISVPDYNFNWQFIYKLDTPFDIPKGSVLKVEGIFDNSFQNPLNPDPSKELRYGKQSIDEMLIGFLNYTIEE